MRLLSQRENGELKTLLEFREKYFAVVEHYDSLGNRKVIDGNGAYEEQNSFEPQEQRVTIRGRVKDGKKEGKFHVYLHPITSYSIPIASMAKCPSSVAIRKKSQRQSCHHDLPNTIS